MSDHLVYGLHAVDALLTSRKRFVQEIVVSEERKDERINRIVKAAEEQGLSILKLSQQAMKKRFGELNHQGVIAKTEKMPDYSERDLTRLLAEIEEQVPLILILDGVTDPHNLGACLRSADAAGVHFVIIPKDKSASITPVVNKVACGAAEMMPLVRVTNLARAMDVLKQEGVWIYGAAGEANETLYQLDLKGPTALVMGAEGSGMRRLTRDHCDGLFSIPMTGIVTSLNVSVAAGVCLFEVVRQRL